MPAKRLSPRAARLILPQHSAPRAAALVIHSWWGLTASFTRFATALAEQGVAVGLADLFDGHVATTEAAARALRRAPRAEPIYRGLQRDLGTLKKRRVFPMSRSSGFRWARMGH